MNEIHDKIAYVLWNVDIATDLGTKDYTGHMLLSFPFANPASSLISVIPRPCPLNAGATFKASKEDEPMDPFSVHGVLPSSYSSAL